MSFENKEAFMKKNLKKNNNNNKQICSGYSNLSEYFES